MGAMVLTKTQIKAGVWEGLLRMMDPAETPPPVEVRHLETALEGVTVTPAGDGRFAVRVPIPAALLSDGVQTFLIRNAETGDTLDHFTIVTGEPLEHDLRAEIDLLRAELDMLKKAFRRHALETMGK